MKNTNEKTMSPAAALRKKVHLMTLVSTLLWIIEFVCIFVKRTWLVSGGSKYGQAVSLYTSTQNDGIQIFAYALIVLSALGFVLTLVQLFDVKEGYRPKLVLPCICAVLAFLVVNKHRRIYKKLVTVGLGMLTIHFGAENIIWIGNIAIFILDIVCMVTSRKKVES